MLILQYAKFVKPAFDDFVLPSKKYTDVIVPRGGDNHVAIDLESDSIIKGMLLLKHVAC